MTELPPHSLLSDEATPYDRLGREGLVTTLTQVLLEAQTPLVVAIYGAWGSGKTSIMMQLQKSLQTGGSKSLATVKTVWFVPWENSSDSQPGVSLLLAIRRDLGLSGATVEKALRAIVLAITDEVRVPYIGLSLGKVRANYQQLVDQDIEKRSEQARLREHYKEVIAEAGGGDDSKTSKTRLVIFIDDLDRCQPATAVAMLEALKLYLNLDGCIFVLGIDRQPIEAAIASEYEGLNIAKESYLDKIVQLPFTIPALSNERVDAYIDEKLPIHLKNCQKMLSLAAPDNPRQLKRTINSLLLLDRIAEISFPNRDGRILCGVALIQNSAPDLYQHLRREPKDWSLLVPSAMESQESTARPAWLDLALKGTEAREALSAALLLLRSLIGTSTGIVDIQPYIRLSEQLEGQSGAKVKRETPERPDVPERPDGQAAVRIDEAIPRYERALAELERVRGPDDPGTLAAQSDLANAYLAAGRIADAIDLDERVLAESERILGPDDRRTVDARSYLASAFRDAGRLEDALPLFERALNDSERILGPDHDGTLSALNNLALTYESLGDMEKAINLYKTGLSRVQSSGASSNKPIFENNLAMAHLNVGSPDEAITLFNSAIADGERILGPEHPSVLMYKANLAMAYIDVGRLAEAITLLQHVIADGERILGPEHPSVLMYKKTLTDAQAKGSASA